MYAPLLGGAEQLWRGAVRLWDAFVWAVVLNFGPLTNVILAIRTRESDAIARGVTFLALQVATIFYGMRWWQLLLYDASSSALAPQNSIEPALIFCIQLSVWSLVASFAWRAANLLVGK